MLPVIQPIQRRQGEVRDVVKERAICTGPYTTVPNLLKYLHI